MTNEEIRYEQDLIRRCQAGDQAAWFELFQRYWPFVWWAARKFLSGEGRRNADLVEEIVAQVWASLGYNQGQRLGGYDPERSRFTTFLARRTWQVVQMDRKRRHWRRQHEVPQNPQVLQDLEPVDPGAAIEASDWRVQEFLATLPEWEAAFFRQALIDPDGASEQPAISATCFRKRLQRLREKFRAFLERRGIAADPGAA